jgi:hypothetical protein
MNTRWQGLFNSQSVRNERGCDYHKVVTYVDLGQCNTTNVNDFEMPPY